MPKTRIEAEELLNRYASGERDFSEARVEGDLSGADLSGANFNNARLSDCYMPRVNLSGANLLNASLTDSCLNGANLISANLQGCKLRGTQLAQADLTNADLQGVLCDNTDFGGANLTGVNLKGVDLDASFRRANLTGKGRASASPSLLRRGQRACTSANLKNANISGSCFENTIMPDGNILTRSPLRKYKLGIIIAKYDGDVYYAQCPDLENCEVSADSLEEAREKIEEAVREYMDALPENYRRVFIDRHIITEVLEISSQS